MQENFGRSHNDEEGGFMQEDQRQEVYTKESNTYKRVFW